MNIAKLALAVILGVFSVVVHAQETYSKEHIFDDDIEIGSKSAPISVVIYGSPTCPHCKSFYRGHFPLLKSVYVDTGHVRMIFREIPTGNARLATGSSMLARCAFEKDGIAGYVKVFTNFYPDGGVGKSTPPDFFRMAADAGFEEGRAAECTSRSEVQKSFRRNANHAFQELKLTSTPGFVVDGTVVSLPTEYNLIFRKEHRLFQLFDKILSEKNIQSKGLRIRTAAREAVNDLAAKSSLNLKSASRYAVEDYLLLHFEEKEKESNFTDPENEFLSLWGMRFDPNWIEFTNYANPADVKRLQAACDRLSSCKPSK